MIDMLPYPNLRQPIRLGGLDIPNRIMFTTHGPRLPQARYLRYIAERASAGVGLMGFNLGPMGIMQFPFGPGRGDPSGDLDSVPMHPLTAEGRAHYDAQIPVYRAWTEAAHRHGAKCFGQLYHSGVAQHTDIFQPMLGPSAIRDESERHNPHPLTATEIGDLIQAYALAAERAVKAGYDGIELHCAHGYLGYQFLSPLFNRRTDRYGGSLENRLRFTLEVFAAVRSLVGPDVPIGVRLNGPDGVDGGLSLDDVVAASRGVAALGAAYVSISGGFYTGLRRGANLPYVAPAFIPPGPNLAPAAAVKVAVDVPVIVTGRFTKFDLPERIVAAGDADLIGMVRALIADPRAIEKAFSGRPAEIAPCIACNECHYGRTVACSTNPAAGREAALEPVSITARQRILIVGAGPAGLECAAAAAARGHEVTLVDRRDRIGGTLSMLTDARHAEFARYLDYMAERLKTVPVDLRLGVEADIRLVGDLAPDQIVVATGAREMIPAFGAAGSVVAARDVLAGRLPAGQRIAVIGGLEDHLPPLVIADLLVREGRSVTLIVETISPAPALEAATLIGYLDQLTRAGVTFHTMTAATGFSDGVLHTRNSITGAAGTIAGIDAVVALGDPIPEDGLAAKLGDLGLPVHLIGDALAPRRMLHATLDGARLGQSI